MRITQLYAVKLCNLPWSYGERAAVTADFGQCAVAVTTEAVAQIFAPRDPAGIFRVYLRKNCATAGEVRVSFPDLDDDKVRRVGARLSLVEMSGLSEVTNAGINKK